MVALVQAVLTMLHIASVGLAAAGPLLAAALRLRRHFRHDADADQCLRRLALWSTAALLASATIGLIAGGWRLWWDDGSYASMLGRFPRRSYEMLAAEWFFTLVCYVLWLVLWTRWREKPWLHAAVALVGSTNLLYHFPPLMIAQNLLASWPDLIAEQQITRSLMLELMYSPIVVAKTVHLWGASIVVAAANLLLATERRPVSGIDTLIRLAVGVALAGVVVQWLSGVAIVALLPAEPGERLLGEPVAASLFAVAILLSVHVLHHLIAATMTPAENLRPRRLVSAVAGVMLLMSLAARF